MGFINCWDGRVSSPENDGSFLYGWIILRGSSLSNLWIMAPNYHCHPKNDLLPSQTQSRKDQLWTRISVGIFRIVHDLGFIIFSALWVYNRFMVDCFFSFLWLILRDPFFVGICFRAWRFLLFLSFLSFILRDPFFVGICCRAWRLSRFSNFS